jgi:hypothetical protein
MPFRRLLGVLLLVVGTSLGLIGPAVAAPYGPNTGSATVSRTKVVQGHEVTVRGNGFCAASVVTITVKKGSHIVSTQVTQASRAGSASDSVRLTVLGRNTLELRGCFKAGVRDQVLAASVVVVPHTGAARVSDDKVSRGDRVTVRAVGFCRNAKVRVRVMDDGRIYDSKSIHATRSGAARTSVALTRAGRATITLSGCSKSGGTLISTAHVKVVNGKSFRASSSAYAGDVAGRFSPVGLFAVGGGLLVFFITAQVMIARRRRSS